MVGTERQGRLSEFVAESEIVVDELEELKAEKYRMDFSEEDVAREEFVERFLAGLELGSLMLVEEVRSELERDWNYRFS